MKTSIATKGVTLGQKIQAYNQALTNWLAPSKAKNQIPALDGVRAVACLAVFSFHLNLLARSHGIWPRFYASNIFIALPLYFAESLAYFGESGVILFFLLSSFLLFLPYARALLFESAWPSPRRFYLRRIFRIVPGYYAAIFLMILLFQPAMLTAKHWHDLWLFLSFQMDPTLSTQLNGAFWTLAIEFQFYLLLPLLAWLFRFLVRQSTALNWRMLKLTFCLLALMAWGLLTRSLGLSVSPAAHGQTTWFYQVFLLLKPFVYGTDKTISSGKFFEVFAVGMLISMLYVYVHYGPSTETSSLLLYRFSALLFSIGLVLLILLSIMHSIVYQYAAYNLLSNALNVYHTQMLFYWLEWEAMSHAISYGLCLLAILYGSSRLKRIFEWSLLRQIGFISFSLYLWHLPLLSTITLFIYDQRDRGSLIDYSELWYWALVIALPLCTLLYRGIEVPGISLGELLLGKLEGKQKKPRAFR